jgi:hypothetical protein
MDELLSPYNYFQSLPVVAVGVELFEQVAEWVYTYDEEGRRVGLINKTEGLTECKKHLTPPFSSPWFWGNAILKESYADHLLGDNYGVLRRITSIQFAKTIATWLAQTISANTNNKELIHVMELEQYAKLHNIKPVRPFIASRIGCSDRRVHDLLRLSSLSYLDEELSNFAIFVETSYSISEGQLHDWYPSKKEIEHKAASIPRICSVGYDRCSGTTQNGKLAICYNCHKKLKMNNMLNLLPDWIVSEESRIRREHYNEAVNACFEDHYGTASVDTQSFYLDAI